jgi:hypothetical protein
MIVMLVEIKDIVELYLERRFDSLFVGDSLRALNSFIFAWLFQQISDHKVFGDLRTFDVNTCYHFMHYLIYLYNSIENL